MRFWLLLWGFRHLCAVPLICYDSLKRASIEVKLMSSYCQTRMRCACMSELACMRVVITFETGKYSYCTFSYKASGGHACRNNFETGKYSFRTFSYKAPGGLIHACINLSCSEKWCFRGSQTRMHNSCVSDRMMKYVLLRWATSLNDRSKLKG